MTTHSRYDVWSREAATKRHAHGDGNVNNIRHTVCKFKLDANAMDFSLQRRRPDRYDVPLTSQSLLKLDDSLISRRLRASLFSASRVYCGNNILNLHKNKYVKPRPKSVQYRWSPPEISLALPKIQRAKTAGLIRLNPTKQHNSATTEPTSNNNNNKYNKLKDVKYDKKRESKPETMHIPAHKEENEVEDSVESKKTAEVKHDADDKPRTKQAADDNMPIADEDIIETVDTNRSGQGDTKQDKDVVEDAQLQGQNAERKKEKKKKRKEEKPRRKEKVQSSIPSEETEEDSKDDHTWLTVSRGDNSDADYSSDDTDE